MELAGAGRHRRIDFSDSDSDDEGAGEPRLQLTTAKASDLCPVPHRLLARAKLFTHIDDLSSLENLDYVDLSNNSLSSLTGLAGLPRLKTVIARSNRVSSAAAADGLAGLPALCVLNLAENDLVDTDWLASAAFAKVLTALVVNGNRIAALDGVSSLTALETLVVSHNEVEDVGVVRYLPRLKKLSASHNRLRVLPPAITTCHGLGELRVAHNRLALLPDESVLACLATLRILDVGHNRLTSLDGLVTLAGSLQQVNVAGNSVSKDAERCRAKVLALCPGLQIIDGSRISGGRRKLRLAREWKERRARPVLPGTTRSDIHESNGAGRRRTPPADGTIEDDTSLQAAKRRRVERSVLPVDTGVEENVNDVIPPNPRESLDDGINPDDFLLQAHSKLQGKKKQAAVPVLSGRRVVGNSRKADMATTIGSGGSSAWD